MADNISVKNAAGDTITVKSKDSGGVQAVTHTLANADGSTVVNPATSDKQPSLGTAGTPSSDVITVQGVASMTALKVDGSGVTQPVSGTFWQTTQPVSAAALPLPSGAATSALQSAVQAAQGAAAPASAVLMGWKDGSGNIQAPSAANPLPISGSISATNPSVGATGSPVPTDATAIGFEDAGGDLLIPSAANPFPVAIISGGGGGSGYSVLNASTYANNGSYSNVPAGGLVGTSAPTFTNGQASPLSLTTAGALRVDGSAVTQPVSGTFWQATQPVSGTVAATQSGTWNVTNISGTVSLPTGAATAAKQPALGTAGSASSDVLSTQGIVGGVPQPVANTIVNPTSTLTRPANTTAYAAGDLIANNTTAGSITVPSVTAARVSGGMVSLNRLRLRTSATSGMSGVNIVVNLWSAAPTYTNGDNGAYAVATGAALYIGQVTFSLQQFADGATATALIADGPINLVATAQTIFWDMQTLSAFTPTSGQTFTVTMEAGQN